MNPFGTDLPPIRSHYSSTADYSLMRWVHGAVPVGKNLTALVLGTNCNLTAVSSGVTTVGTDNRAPARLEQFTSRSDLCHCTRFGSKRSRVHVPISNQDICR